MTRKARIVARGLTQRSGINYNKIFSPVACLNSVRLATALTSEYGMVMEQIDVTAAYINGSLEEAIYMKPSEITEKILKYIIRTESKNFKTRENAKNILETLRTGDKVCLLKKALYELR